MVILGFVVLIIDAAAAVASIIGGRPVFAALAVTLGFVAYLTLAKNMAREAEARRERRSRGASAAGTQTGTQDPKV